MKKLSFIFLALTFSLAFFAGCKKTDNSSTTVSPTTLSNLKVASDFNWTTGNTVEVKITGAAITSPVRSKLSICLANGDKVFNRFQRLDESATLKLVVPKKETQLIFKLGSASFNVPIFNGVASFFIPQSFAGSIQGGGEKGTNTDGMLSPGDQDDDGVPDEDDAYPTDPLRSMNSYYPSEIGYGSLAFEDLWPAKGDYDFNDVVVDYQIQTVTNADNNVVEVFGKFILRASGASYHNGFGFQFDYLDPEKITGVSGNSIHVPSIFSMSANGLEAGQTYANCIVFDDFYKVMSWPGTGHGINTELTAPFVPYVTLNVHVSFTMESGQMVPDYMLTSDMYNFYIVADQVRGKEIHLADRMPSSLADATLFGTLDDDSDTGGDMVTIKYYKTENNLPWGINLLERFDYPIEKAPIGKRFPTDVEAYYHFIDWAESNGLDYLNWYTEEPGNRNVPLIYPYPVK
jgi:LruC domain-containing protein